MLDRGKLAVLAMFALAIVAAGFAWWWNYQRGQKCLAFYGADAALLIRTGEDVVLLELVPDRPDYTPKSVDTLKVGQETYRLYRATTISKAKGLIHARTSLVDDASYFWDGGLANCQPQVQFAVRFGDHSPATVAFDFGCQRVWHVEQGKHVTLIPKVAEGWKSFLTRQATARTDAHAVD